MISTVWIVDAALLLTLLEAAGACVLGARLGGWPRALHFFNALAGGLLLLALRCALTGADWPWIPLCLAGAGAAHLEDVRRRR